MAAHQSYHYSSNHYHYKEYVPAPVKPYRFETVHPSSNTYQEIANMITNKSIIIENIVKVHNPELEKAYNAKKSYKESKGPLTEHFLFHGTKKEYVNDICAVNFDWRCSQKHKYGRGVCFSHNANYASNYCDYGYNKVMLLAKVLVAKACIGHKDMEYPPPGYDTSQKDDSTLVVVKYDDDEYLPAYKIYYHFEEEEEECWSDTYYGGSDYSDYGEYYSSRDNEYSGDYDSFDFDEDNYNVYMNFYYDY